MTELDDVLAVLDRYGFTCGDPDSDCSKARAVISAALEDARRYNKLKPMMTAANFHPEDPNGLDLGEGVALIFMLPVGTPVCSKLDSIIDGIDAATGPDPVTAYGEVK